MSRPAESRTGTYDAAARRTPSQWGRKPIRRTSSERDSLAKNGVLRPSRSHPSKAILEAMHGTIVCGVTGAPEGRAAAQLAAAVANRLGLRLVLVHVVAAAGSRPPDATTEHEHLLEYGVVEAALDAIALDHAGAVETRIVAGNRVDALVQVAAEEGADVIVVGSRPRGARGRQLRCSLARELEAAQSVPVLIAPPATRKRSARRLALAEAPAGR
jgi:nucleotide-binding universal stress UspA family protein